MGISNREWLYSLDVADLADWFDAEHVDDAISENLGLSQDSEIDSREKLEADVQQYIIGHVTHEGEEILMERIVCAIPWPDVFKLLDRQVAIDRKEFQTILEEIQKCVRNGSR